MKPALTKEEWEARQASTEHFGHNTRYGFTGMNPAALAIISAYGGSGATDDPAAFHGIAAFALHGQPFGFTREDVAMLRVFASPPDAPAFTPLLDLADRIEALLPPE